MKLQPLTRLISCEELIHKKKMLCTNVRQLQWNQPKGITKMEELSKYEVAQHECKKRKKNRIEAGTK